MGNGEWGMGNGELGMGNGEWGMGNGEWGMRRLVCKAIALCFPKIYEQLIKQLLN
jgi:hypothetical protein